MLYLAERAHSHLEDYNLVVRLDTENSERQTKLVVVVALSFMSFERG